jgi:hypothetical protein
LHKRKEQAARAGIEQALDQHRLVPRHANHRLGAAADRGAQMRHHVDEVIGRMLHVDEHPVEAGTGDHLGGDRAGHTEPQSDLRLAGRQRPLETIRRQIVDHGGPRIS